MMKGDFVFFFAKMPIAQGLLVLGTSSADRIGGALKTIDELRRIIRANKRRI
jgi:hypothetical protein